ncbi:MAG: hypothetical protein ACT4NY_26975 [Pseudonocardiales bacterium]
MSRLTGPEFFQLKGLRQVRRGGLVHGDGHYYDQGAPVSGRLIPIIVEGLLEAGLAELGDPDEYGLRQVALTEAGQACYRVLCQRQRRKDLVVSLPEHGCTTETSVCLQASTVDRGTVDPVE